MLLKPINTQPTDTTGREHKPTLTDTQRTALQAISTSTALTAHERTQLLATIARD